MKRRLTIPAAALLLTTACATAPEKPAPVEATPPARVAVAAPVIKMQTRTASTVVVPASQTVSSGPRIITRSSEPTELRPETSTNKSNGEASACGTDEPMILVEGTNETLEPGNVWVAMNNTRTQLPLNEQDLAEYWEPINPNAENKEDIIYWFKAEAIKESYAEYNRQCHGIENR